MRRHLSLCKVPYIKVKYTRSTGAMSVCMTSEWEEMCIYGEGWVDVAIASDVYPKSSFQVNVAASLAKCGAPRSVLKKWCSSFCCAECCCN
jgi:hypothetical protein